MKTTVTLGRLKFEAHAGSGGLLNVILDSAKGMQEIHVTPGEWESLTAVLDQLAALTVQRDEARAEVTRLTERRFPILVDGKLATRPLPTSVPWSMVAPHERQAIANHGQTLDVLAQRGGLDPSELWCVVHSKRWSQRPHDTNVDAWLSEWASENERLRTELAELRAKQAAFVEATSHGG